MNVRPCICLLASFSTAALVACRSNPTPVAAPAPPPLSDSAAAGLRWVQSHAAPLVVNDSVPDAGERSRYAAFAGDARIVGISELTEGTHEFPIIVRRMLNALADTAGFRAVAIQAPMVETMALDYYVRTGVGDPTRLLRSLGSGHWETVEMRDLVNWLREYNRARPDDQRVGFYGFELPSAVGAVRIVTSLPRTIMDSTLHAWVAREYACVAIGESAQWGREGPKSDSTYWSRCRVVAAQVLDSIVALRRRASGAPPASLVYAEQMARLIQHSVNTALRRLSREETVAEHVLWLADSLGTNGRLLVWGRDVEAGRLELDRRVVQMAVPLSTKLGGRYRAIAFAIGEGFIRARQPARGRAEPTGLRNVPVGAPPSRTYEDVLARTAMAALFVDLRGVATDSAASWLRGPHPVRLIGDIYAPEAPSSFLTPIEFPKNFDAVAFVQRASAARGL